MRHKIIVVAPVETPIKTFKVVMLKGAAVEHTASTPGLCLTK